MSNREDAEVLTVVTYRRDDAGNVYRLRESVRESYHTDDGGYVPQRVIWMRESYVYSTDPDAVTAEEYCDELERAEIEGSFG